MTNSIPSDEQSFSVAAKYSSSLSGNRKLTRVLTHPGEGELRLDGPDGISLEEFIDRLNEHIALEPAQTESRKRKVVTIVRNASLEILRVITGK